MIKNISLMYIIKVDLFVLFSMKNLYGPERKKDLFIKLGIAGKDLKTKTLENS